MRPREPSGPAGSTLQASLLVRRMIFGHVITQIVAAVARLGLADLLAGGPRPAADLAHVTGTDPDTLARLLRAAATLELFEEPEPAVFALAPLGEWLRSEGRTLRDLAVALTAPAHWRSIERLLDSVRTGRAAAPDALGTTLWAYYDEHPGEGAVFAAAMSNISAAAAEEVASVFDVSRFERLVDVGGSRGVLLTRLLEANPRARGVLFDLPTVADGAREALAGSPVAGRVDVVAGNFLEQVPEGGDLYLLKHILHDWDDEHAARILHNCRRAARAGSTLLVVERVLDRDADPLAHVADMLMLVMFGGRERTRAEYEGLMRSAGFRLERVVPLSLYRLLEATAV